MYCSLKNLVKKELPVLKASSLHHQKGTHDELMKIGGVYDRLVQHQTFNNKESAESCTLDYAVQ